MNITKKELGTIIFALENYAELLEKENSNNNFIHNLIIKLDKMEVK